MVRVSIEVRNGAARFNVAVGAQSIERAVSVANGSYPNCDVRVKFPIDPEGFFVKESAPRAAEMVGGPVLPTSRFRPPSSSFLVRGCFLPAGRTLRQPRGFVKFCLLRPIYEKQGRGARSGFSARALTVAGRGSCARGGLLEGAGHAAAGQLSDGAPRRRVLRRDDAGGLGDDGGQVEPGSFVESLGEIHCLLSIIGERQGGLQGVV
jgi:hypothetical protein